MKLELNIKLYQKIAVLRTIEAFEGLATFEFFENEKQYLISIDNIDDSVQLFFKEEFCNYVLSQLK